MLSTLCGDVILRLQLAAAPCWASGRDVDTWFKKSFAAWSVRVVSANVVSYAGVNVHYGVHSCSPPDVWLGYSLLFADAQEDLQQPY